MYWVVGRLEYTHIYVHAYVIGIHTEVVGRLEYTLMHVQTYMIRMHIEVVGRLEYTLMYLRAYVIRIHTEMVGRLEYFYIRAYCYWYTSILNELKVYIVITIPLSSIMVTHPYIKIHIHNKIIQQ